MKTSGKNSTKSSITGTSSTEEKSEKQVLSAGDICRIIKQCQGSGISELSYLGLSLKFHSHRNESADGDRNASAHEPVVNDLGEAPLQELSKETKEEAELMNREALEEAEISQLLIDDPAAYEKMVMDRDIERVRVTQ